MTDAQITISLKGVPAGSPVCGECKKRFDQIYCHAFPGEYLRHEKQESNKGCGRYYFIYYRCPACLAAEERFSPDPPTGPGWYKARLRCTQQWEIVEIFKEHGWRLAVHRIGSETSYPLELFDLWGPKLDMPGGE